MLTTWFPYPLDQGSRIRAHHLIRALASAHELALISFEDQPLHPSWLEQIGTYFSWIKTLPEKPFEYSKWRSFLGFFSIKPASVVAGLNRRMEKLVIRSAQEWKPDAIFAFTFVTAPYALKLPGVIRIVDMDNLLALMLKEEISFSTNWLSKIRKTIAYWKFKRYEDQIYRPFDQCLVVSELDVERVQQYTKISPSQIKCIPNGVDLQAYQLSAVKKPDQLIYHGALTYHPNFDAVQYFLAEIFPLILLERPETRLIVTGSTSGVDLNALQLNQNVSLSGYVPDIRPLIAESQVCIVPLRQGAGTRLKILEAMALATAVVSTSKGAEGLAVQDQKDIWIADSASDFASAVLALLSNAEKRDALRDNATKLVQNRYDWEMIGQELIQSLPQNHSFNTGTRN